MQVTRPTAVPNSLAPGEHDAQFLEASYIADLTVDGQPLNAYAKALATFGVKTAATSSTIVAGADWALDKNLGRGQVYDMLHPLSSDAATRPRAYSDIPAQHDLGLFVEDNTTVALGRSRLEVMPACAPPPCSTCRGNTPCAAGSISIPVSTRVSRSRR